MSTALILVDIQKDYFPNGKMELSNPESAAANAAKILEWFRQNQKENIIHVQHIASSPAMGFFLPETEGIDIHEAVQPLEHERVIVKQFANSVLQTGLASQLKEKDITKIVVAGMMTHTCIDATVRAAVDLGYETTLVEDACARKELAYQGKVVSAEEVHYAFVGALQGMYAEVLSTEAFLQQEATT